MKNKKLYNYLPNLIISLFLAFIFLALSLLFAADNIFFEPTTYTNSMYKIKIEDTAFEEIQTYCEQQYAYTGVEADTLKKSINKTDVSNAIYSYVEDTFSYILGKKSGLPEFKADFTLLEKNISDDYTKWAKKEGVEYTQELEDIKQKTIKNVEQAIESDLDVMLLSHINKPNGISTKLKDTACACEKNKDSSYCNGCYIYRRYGSSKQKAYMRFALLGRYFTFLFLNAHSCSVCYPKGYKIL